MIISDKYIIYQIKSYEIPFFFCLFFVIAFSCRAKDSTPEGFKNDLKENHAGLPVFNTG